MSLENHFYKTTADNIALCRETLPGISLVEICDRRRVLIENHCGIIAYGCREILVKVKYGHICVSGANLKLTKMNKDKLVIIGDIRSVCLQGRD